MSFFDSPPPPRTGWRPPAWDRPSEAVLGAAVPLTLLLGRNDEYAFALEELRAYPNGFTCSVVTLRSPLTQRDMHHPMGMHPMMTARGPRIGFEFSDGSDARFDRPPWAPRIPGGGGSSSVSTVAVLAAGQGTVPTNPFGIPVDDDGIPLRPYLAPRGGGGNGDRFTMTYWCYPLPPPGPMTIHADWPDQGFEEVAIPFDADRIREAARDAVTLWEPDA
jgi:hypothetical protein